MRRWPAEWEPHAATWIGWPHHQPDWPGKFEPIPWVYAEIVRELHRFERVHILCDSEETCDAALETLHAHDVDVARCTFHIVPTDRVWLRDSGPTGVYGPNGFEWIAWQFNAWAKYENYRKDQLVASIVAELTQHDAVRVPRPESDRIEVFPSRASSLR